jgi:hypothetical protein
MSHSENSNDPLIWYRWDKSLVKPQVQGLVCSIEQPLTTEGVKMDILHIILVLYAVASIVLIVAFARLRDRFPIKGRAP